MQDYLSLRCLNAEIRKWIIKEEKPSCIDYEQYDAKTEVLQRYQITDEVELSQEELQDIELSEDEESEEEQSGEDQ